MSDVRRLLALILLISGVAAKPESTGSLKPVTNSSSNVKVKTKKVEMADFKNETRLDTNTTDNVEGLTNESSAEISSVVNLTADPLVFQPALTRKLTIRCSVLNTSVTPVMKDNPGGKNEILNQKKASMMSSQDDVTNLLSIVITKVNDGTGKNEVAARVAGCLAADVEVNVLGQVEIEGNTEGSPVAGEAGYLQLTWDRPLGNSAGAYTCEVSALNANKHSISLNTTVRVQAEQPSISYLSMYISQHDRHIESLTKRTLELEQENKNLNTLLQFSNSNLSADLTAFKDKINEQKLSEIQIGNITCREGNKSIRFKRPFKTVPTVTTFMSDLSFSLSYHKQSTKLTASNVVKTGFTAECSVNGDTSATHVWLAMAP
ncbi:uncharacterized protein LOC131950992 [Physella acuta]|uniref:uncharacterized protein LOC131950992 n=1 Tax=Physella acuta TaxID=109671 RepID=UPI0027DB5191|nr:uncharacterized protein LOC131950992 [Physella acuta]